MFLSGKIIMKRYHLIQKYLYIILLRHLNNTKPCLLCICDASDPDGKLLY